MSELHIDPQDKRQEESRKVVLLIEDNHEQRELYGSLLWYNGFDLIHAADGESGVAKALGERPDLILLDLNLPGDLDGFGVFDRIRSAGLDTPIIVLSAIARERAGERASRFGTYLEKPIPPLEVLRAVQHEIGFPG